MPSNHPKIMLQLVFLNEKPHKYIKVIHRTSRDKKINKIKKRVKEKLARIAEIYVNAANDSFNKNIIINISTTNNNTLR